MQHHQHQHGPFENLRAASNLVSFIGRIGAVTVEVFLHSRFGARYIGAQGAAAMLLIPCFSMFFPDQDARPLLCFLAAFMCMCLLVKIDVQWRQRRGDVEHSRYNGWPRLLHKNRLRSERFVKQFVEPALVCMAGAYSLGYSVPLGAYLMFASLCLMATNGEIRQRDQERAMDLQDAMYDQQDNARIWRELQGRR